MAAFFKDYQIISNSGLFDPAHYLATYPEVAERNVDPLLHYLEEGAAQGRSPHPDFDPDFYLRQCREYGEDPENPLLHYIRVGSARGLKPRAEPAAGLDTPAPVTPETGKSPILAAVESLGVAGGPGGGLRVSINGWALAAAPIAEISASIGEAVVGIAVRGIERPDIAALYPDREDAERCGFILAFELPRQARPTVEVALTVRTEEGEIGRRSLHIDVPPEEIDVPVLDPLSEERFEPPKPARAPMQLYLDDVSVSPSGVLHIEGWVVCLVQIQSVEAFIGDERIGEADFGRVRDDVAKARSDYPNSRFSGFVLDSLVGRQGPGRRSILVRAVARTGIVREISAEVQIPELAAIEPAADEEALHHHCDEISLTTSGHVIVKGWVVCATPVTSIIVALDGEPIGQAELGFERADVGNHFAELPHARQSGFAFRAASEKPLSGEHLLTLDIGCAGGRLRRIELPALATDAAEDGTSAGAAAGAVGDSDRKLRIDIPLVIGGAMEMPVRGNLEISGWALARFGVDAVEIALDGTSVAIADYGVRRLDIQAAFPDWEGALGSGFLAVLPHRVLPVGGHTVSVTLRDNTGKTAKSAFRIEVEQLSTTDGPWALRRRLPPAELALDLAILDHRHWHPRFDVLLPLNGSEEALELGRRTIASLQAQAYANWRLFLIGTDSRCAAGLRGKLLSDRHDDIAPRVRTISSADLGTLGYLPAGALGCDDAFVTILNPGDEIGCDAFLEIALTTAEHADCDFLYSDERRLNPAIEAVDAFFKPQWSPDLLLSTNYIGRLWCARVELLRRIVDPDEPLLQHGEYDLILRCTEAAKAVRHLPLVLCERGDEPMDHAEEDKKALGRALLRRDIAGDIRPGALPGTYRPKRSVATDGLVSIIIPTRATGGMIKTCIETLRHLTAYPNYEIVCIENIPPEDADWRDWLRANADWVVSTEEPFNWSRFNNLASAQTGGEFLLFLNDDVEIIDPDWLLTLLEHAQRPEVGVVGPRLLYPDRRVQHAGMFLSTMGQGRHAFRYAKADDPGYFGLAQTQRNVIAVTGACLLTRRSTYDALGGFDEAHGVINNDLDFCLKAWERGLVNIYTPHTTLIHHEAVSRAALPDDYDATIFESRWRSLFLAGDPYFHPNLAKGRDDVSIDAEPSRLVFAGHPSLVRDSIRKILVVKLDHIGDCITAFPAIRRLKRHFPEAHIEVLSSRASKSVWAMEPAVERVIEFDFFHARSSLGQLERTAAEYQALRAELLPERFDLAVDLRKHPETRPVLQYTGARYLAGFDHRDRFQWLDVGLDWSGDQAFAHKRQHTADDLINLVDAIAAACEVDRSLIVKQPCQGPALARLPFKRSADRALVCVHLTAGNQMKQWPVEFFAAVIDRLAEEDRAQIVLIGAPGDEDTEAELMQRVRNPQSVASLVGKLPLAELPLLLAQASLFLGNDSGPKHIAAGLGVPTVAVHSGTVDPREWGPIGPNAVAVVREVVCTPCYLSALEDCHRGLACMRQLSPELVYRACKRLLLLGRESGAVRPAAPTGMAARRKRRADRVRKAAAGLQGAGA